MAFNRGILRAPKVKRRGVRRPVVTRKSAFKSKLEERVAEQITNSGLEHRYESVVLRYTVPERKAKYTPDFPIGDGKVIYLEAKGRFRTAAERQKMILVRDQNPGVDIRLVFQKAELPIYKNSPTSHAKWATDNGFRWADKGIVPEEWLQEATNG